MGRMTEFFAYLEGQPKDLVELKKKLNFLSIDEKCEEVRKNLKLYRNK